ncbi:CG15024 [Drosophila busckii]|uniref:CG15024 n=2 Tax=Drosophila busckii TaxID=30019 RepID=A0A0M4EJG9_DROBS|nr:CG15024 [Drosophila busckii]
MRFFGLGLLAVLLLSLQLAAADVSQLVRSGNGFVYDVPRVTQLELEVNNEFPTGQEFPQDAIPVAPSDAELGVAEPEPDAYPDSSTYVSSKDHGYAYQVPSKRFKS